MSSEPSIIEDWPHGQPVAGLLLAHGAGAAMDSPFMIRIAGLLAERDIAVMRFEFAYMAARRNGGKRRPPPRAEALTDEYAVATAAARARLQNRCKVPLLIGGKSMGGRVATLVADRLHAEGAIAGTVVLGYPFHPPGQPDRLRTSHLERLVTPLLVVQGDRDPFGAREEVQSYPLASTVQIVWATDGDHDLGPRGGSGTTRAANLADAADAIAAFARTVGGAPGVRKGRTTAAR